MKYNRLGNTGLLVSNICLGTMTYGGVGRWQFAGSLGQSEVNEQLKAAIDAGVNFIDTANAYSEGESERLTGQGLRDVGISRHDVVLATKVRIRMGEGANSVGLSRAHIMHQIDESLRRLNTDYIDLYQIHGVDPLTPIEETLGALDDLVTAGKVRYIGCSNLMAWHMAKAAGVSERRNWARFVSLQAYYCIAARDLEREVVPCLADLGMGLMVWSPLAGGFLSGKFRRDAQGPEGSRRTSFEFPPMNLDRSYNCIEAMDAVARRHGTTVARVALAYCLHKPFVTTIIIGAKSMAQLTDNLAAGELKLTPEDMAALDEVSALPLEYPGWMVGYQERDRQL